MTQNGPGDAIQRPGEVVSLLICIDSVGMDAGTEKQVFDLIPRLDRNRFDVHLCCLEPSAQFDSLASCCHTRLFPVRRVYSLNGFRQICALRDYIRGNRIDLVHTFLLKANIFAVPATWGSGCRAVVASRRNMGYVYTPTNLRVFRFLDRYTTRLLANSEAVKRDVVRYEKVPPRKVDVLYNGVDLSRFAGPGYPAVPRSLGVPEDAPVVGVVANLRPVKDLDLFLRAARVVAGQVPDAVFLLVGRGPLRDELGRRAAELGIAGKVFFSDGKGEVLDYLRRMTIGCLCSQSEGLSNAILEYMATGLPSVVTAVGGNPELVEDGVTGYLVPDRTPEALAARILLALQNPERSREMGRVALARCRERFDIQVAVRDLERYYLSLLGMA